VPAEKGSAPRSGRLISPRYSTDNPVLRFPQLSCRGGRLSAIVSIRVSIFYVIKHVGFVGADPCVCPCKLWTQILGKHGGLPLHPQQISPQGQGDAKPTVQAKPELWENGVKSRLAPSGALLLCNTWAITHRFCHPRGVYLL